MPYKVDVILSSKINKRRGEVASVATFIQSPEDLISAKLRTIKTTVQDSQRALKDEDDVLAILRFTSVDKKAVHSQDEKDQTLAIWKRLAD